MDTYPVWGPSEDNLQISVFCSCYFLGVFQSARLEPLFKTGNSVSLVFEIRFIPTDGGPNWSVPGVGCDLSVPMKILVPQVASVDFDYSISNSCAYAKKKKKKKCLHLGCSGSLLCGDGDFLPFLTGDRHLEQHGSSSTPDSSGGVQERAGVSGVLTPLGKLQRRWLRLRTYCRC